MSEFFFKLNKRLVEEDHGLTLVVRRFANSYNCKECFRHDMAAAQAYVLM